MRSIFRPEVLAQRQAQWLGAIVLVRPPSFAVMAIGAALVAAALLTFLFVGEYTKKARVVGHLVPAAGVLKLYVREPAVVREQRVQEGDRVRAGDLLFVFESERVTADGEDQRAQMRSGFVARAAQLRREASALAAAAAHEQAALAARLTSSRARAQQAQQEVELQRSRAALARQALERQRELAAQGLVAAAAVETAEAAHAGELGRELTARREAEALQAEIESLSQSLAQARARLVAGAAANERALAELSQQEGEFAIQATFALRAPRDGVITAVQAHVGQTAQPAQPLATLLPADGDLVAHLYVPSRAVGFIDTGRRVLLRYQAYPYQKFGQYEGRVESVSKTALSPAELANLGLGGGSDPLYRLIVRPLAQQVIAYGEPQPLQSGMQVEADVLLERRRLIEWLFEPLFGWGRRL